MREQNHHADVYVLIGETEASGKKPKKVDMTGSRWLWVDIDPRAGEPLEEERERIRHLLNSGVPDGVPSPTMVVDSGSWLLGALGTRRSIHRHCRG